MTKHELLKELAKKLKPVRYRQILKYDVEKLKAIFNLSYPANRVIECTLSRKDKKVTLSPGDYKVIGTTLTLNQNPEDYL